MTWYTLERIHHKFGSNTMEPEDKLDATKKFLETWVERNRINQELLPFVTDELERTNWEISVRTVLENHPVAGTALPANLNSQVEHKYIYLLSELPMLPERAFGKSTPS